jgi:IS30 family transposase
MAKLTEAQVVEIRRRRASGENIRAMAKELGIARSTIHMIGRRVTWSHVP